MAWCPCPRWTDATCYLRRGCWLGRCCKCRLRPADSCCSPCCNCPACCACCDLRRSVCCVAAFQFWVGAVLGAAYTVLVVVFLNNDDQLVAEDLFFGLLLYLMIYWWIYTLSGLAGCCVACDKQGITTYEPRVLLMARIYFWLTLLCTVGHLDIVVLSLKLGPITTTSILVSFGPIVWDWYFVYLAWSLVVKLKEQRAGVFRGKPIMRNQRKPEHVLELHAAHNLELRPPPLQFMRPAAGVRPGQGAMGLRWSAPSGASQGLGTAGPSSTVTAPTGHGQASGYDRRTVPPAASSDVSSQWNVRDSSLVPSSESINARLAEMMAGISGAGSSMAAGYTNRSAAALAGGTASEVAAPGGDGGADGTGGFGGAASDDGSLAAEDEPMLAAGMPAPLSQPLPPLTPHAAAQLGGTAAEWLGDPGAGPPAAGATAAARLYGDAVPLSVADVLGAIQEEDVTAAEAGQTGKRGRRQQPQHLQPPLLQQQHPSLTSQPPGAEPQPRSGPQRPPALVLPPGSAAGDEEEAPRPSWPRRLYQQHKLNQQQDPGQPQRPHQERGAQGHYRSHEGGGAADRHSGPPAGRSPAMAALPTAKRRGAGDTAGTYTSGGSGAMPVILGAAPYDACASSSGTVGPSATVFELRRMSTIAATGAPAAVSGGGGVSAGGLASPFAGGTRPSVVLGSLGGAGGGGPLSGARPHNPPVPAVESVVLSVPVGPMHGMALYTRAGGMYSPPTSGGGGVWLTQYGASVPSHGGPGGGGGGGMGISPSSQESAAATAADSAAGGQASAFGTAFGGGAPAHGAGGGGGGWGAGTQGPPSFGPSPSLGRRAAFLRQASLRLRTGTPPA